MSLIEQYIKSINEKYNDEVFVDEDEGDYCVTEDYQVLVDWEHFGNSYEGNIMLYDCERSITWELNDEDDVKRAIARTVVFKKLD